VFSFAFRSRVSLILFDQPDVTYGTPMSDGVETRVDPVSSLQVIHSFLISTD
jgi:hypothetical protein